MSEDYIKRKNRNKRDRRRRIQSIWNRSENDEWDEHQASIREMRAKQVELKIQEYENGNEGRDDCDGRE